MKAVKMTRLMGITMTEPDTPTVRKIRWGWQIALGGLGIAMLTVSLAFFDLNVPRLYWIAVVSSLGGIVGATAFGAQYSSVQYGIGVISMMIGVLLVGYGAESQILLVSVIGVLIAAIAVGGVIRDTRRLE